MNIACPECSTLYRIDPDRIPAGGVAASCRECGTRFRVDDTLGPTAAGEWETASRVETAATGTTEATAPVETHTVEAGQEAPAATGTAAWDEAEPEAPLVQETSEWGEGGGEEEGEAEGEDEAEAEAEAEVEAAAEAEAEGELEAEVEVETGAEVQAEGGVEVEAGDEVEEEEAEPAPAFGPQDPDTRARRLARALVSDIKVYHPDKWESAVAEGTLRAEFRDEILKSWDEYVEQVGEEMAKKTPYFRDALNEILAQGEHVF